MSSDPELPSIKTAEDTASLINEPRADSRDSAHDLSDLTDTSVVGAADRILGELGIKAEQLADADPLEKRNLAHKLSQRSRDGVMHGPDLIAAARLRHDEDAETARIAFRDARVRAEAGDHDAEAALPLLKSALESARKPFDPHAIPIRDNPSETRSMLAYDEIRTRADTERAVRPQLARPTSRIGLFRRRFYQRDEAKARDLRSLYAQLEDSGGKGIGTDSFEDYINGQELSPSMKSKLYQANNRARKIINKIQKLQGPARIVDGRVTFPFTGGRISRYRSRSDVETQKEFEDRTGGPTEASLRARAEEAAPPPIHPGN